MTTRRALKQYLSVSLLWACVSLPALVAAADTPARPPGNPPSVLLALPLRNTAPAVAEIESGFRETLERSIPSPVDLHVEHLDLPDPSATPYAAALVELLRARYSGRPVDVVVAVGIEPLGFMARNRDALFPGVPLVIALGSREVLENGSLPGNATALFVPLEGTRTAEVMLDLHPDAQRVVIMSGSSPDDRDLETIARRDLVKRAAGLEVVSLMGVPLAEQLERLAHLPERSVVLFAGYRADSQGRSMVARDVLRRVARVSNAPIYGSSDTFLGNGVVGGDLALYSRIGSSVAELTVRVLKGEPASAIAPIDVSRSAFMFDWKELKRWGIDEARLPAGSLVLNRPKTLWSEYRWHIVSLASLLVAQAVIIAALLRARRSRRRAEADLRSAEQRYRTVAEFTYDWEYWKRPDGSMAFVSPSCQRATGYEAEEFYHRPSLVSELVLEEDRDAWEAHRIEAQSGTGPLGLEFRIRDKTGRVRWIDHVCNNVTGEQGEFLGVRGSNRDISRRKRSEIELQGALTEIQNLRERLEADNTYLREELQPEHGFEGVVGASDAMRYVFSKAQQVAPTSSTVLLLGETGVGKDLVARSIHSLSARRDRPLVKLNCAALPPSLVESELFGHEKGAFTGAVGLRRGRFEVADGSTLFLDEVGELPLDLQAKLLRVIQDGEFERVGGTATLKTSARLIAATNRRMDEEVRAGRFRADLWYRLNVFPITVPPLRQRREDIPLLVRFFVEKHCRRTGKPVLEVSRGVMKDLEAQDWPGNVRELESVVERAVITSGGRDLRLGPESSPAVVAVAEEDGSGGVQTLSQLERDHIVSALERSFWRLEGDGGAAERLGINPSTLRSRMRKLGIRRPGSRPFGQALGSPRRSEPS